MIAQGIPDKGAILTKLSAYWFSVLTTRIPSLHTHFITLDLPEKLAKSDLAPNFQGRSMQVRRLKTFAIESIVRGYLTGGAWSEYKKSGTVHGMKMPEGLRECEQMPKPLWTPSTKAEQGEHDENISPAQGEFLKCIEKATKAEDLKLQRLWVKNTPIRSRQSPFNSTSLAETMHLNVV
jgi:phosphoribosylaminoimidazole-succinocarboxamide synthase